MPENQPLQPDERARNPSPMRITERDLDILEGIYRNRALTGDQIDTLYFGTEGGEAKTASKRRLRKLYDHRFVERKFLPVYKGSSPTIYVLDRLGADALRRERGHDGLTWYNSNKDLKHEFLEHTIALADFMAAVQLATQSGDYTFDEWITEQQIKADYDYVTVKPPRGKLRKLPVMPDTYFAVTTKDGRRYPYFVELDRGTTTTKRFKDKVRAYIEYHKSGLYTKRFNNRAITVLTVISTTAKDGGTRRLRSLKQATESIGKPQWFLFTVLPLVAPETVFAEPIWNEAGSKELRPLITVV